MTLQPHIAMIRLESRMQLVLKHLSLNEIFYNLSFQDEQ